MMINRVNSGDNSHMAKSQISGSGEVAQLEQQKKALQEEIKSVKEDDKMQPEAKNKKLDILQKKLQRIEDAIQKASKKAKTGEGKELKVTEERKNLSALDSKKNKLHDVNLKDKDQTQMTKNKYKNSEEFLDIYV